MTGTDEMVTWLRARLEDDARSAQYRVDDYHQFGPSELDPEHVLAQLDAVRQVLDECDRTLENDDYGLHLADRVIRLLALPYADQPGYRDEWKMPL